MRFLRDGTDIPDNLIRAVTEGNATFLCGAGVSKQVGLPLFDELTAGVYQQLGDAPSMEPAEEHAISRYEYDRALRSLEKRTHRPGTPSRVRTAVADLLETPSGISFANHEALLHLSRDTDGRPRLITTNFDTLFEQAANMAGISVPSYAGKSIPKPGGERDYGILHLHGRIADADLSIEQTDLILTSADFGDAYLRDGWASQYVEDRMRLGIIVLVGYRAEDAALRLLLETLDADRGRFKDLKDIYALDKRTKESASIWKAKGIIPIEFSDHPDIYATLNEWARYAKDPESYSGERIESIFDGPKSDKK